MRGFRRREEALRPNSTIRAGIEFHPAAYVLVAALLLLYLLALALNEPWTADFWVHLGAVREVAEHPLPPGHPFVGGEGGDPSLSPYVVLLGLASRMSGGDALMVLAIAGFFNLALWLYAFRRFVLVVTASAAAAVWALLFTLLAWGIGTWQWSGYFSLNSIGFGAPYPSMFTSAVALLALTSVHRWLVRGDRRDLVVVGVAVPIVLLTHLYTALWSSIAGIAIVASEFRKDRIRRVTLLIGIAGAGAGLAFLWPYYSLLKLFTIAGQLDPASRPLYEQLGPRSFLALPGVVALGVRARRNPRDAMVLTFVGTALVFAIGGLTDRWSAGRVFPGMMLAAHIALGDAVANVRLKRHPDTQRHFRVTAVAAGLLVIGFGGSYLGIIYAVPRILLPDKIADRLAEDRVDAYRPLSAVIDADDRVVASVSLNRPVAGISGNVLVPLLPTFADDLEERSRDARAILSPSTSALNRRTLIDRWDISFLALTTGDAQRLRPSLGGAAVVLRTDSYEVIDVSGLDSVILG
jgi:hypothetical protein